MRFDENAPGGGVEAVYRLENGKAFLEWKLYFAEDVTELGRNGPETEARIYVTDREGNLVLECRQQLREEEPLQSVLLQPRLWKGVEEPCLYDTEAILMDGSGCCRDRVRGHLPLRSLCSRQSGSLALNGAAWEPRAVRYFLPDIGGAADRCRQMEKDLRMLLELGANCVCLEGWDEGRVGLDEKLAGETALYRFFLQLCDRLGFLVFGKRKGSSEHVWIQEADIGARVMRRESVTMTCGAEVPALRSRKEDIAVSQKKDVAVSNEREVSILRGEKVRPAAECEREMPILQGEKGSAAMRCGMEKIPTLESGERALGSGQQAEALLPDGEHPGPCFYRCLAEWGRKPFVYIVPESVRKMESGNYTALCYSNCDKVALYSDGILFEFQSGEREFCFQEIPAKSPCIMLAAEGEGCGESMSVHKSFVKQWENEGIWH